MLINACNFLVAYSCVGTMCLGQEVLFLLISVQCLWLFYNQRYSQQLIDCWQPPPTNVKHLKPTNPWEVFADSWICFIKRACLNFGLYISCVVDSLVTIGDIQWRESATTFQILCGVLFFVWVLIIPILQYVSQLWRNMWNGSWKQRNNS